MMLYDDEIPTEFICPITNEIMKHPLMLRSGHSFERDAILTWMAEHNHSCPLTRQPLTASDLVPNRALESRIKSWFGVRGVAPQDEELTGLSVLVTCKIPSAHGGKRNATRRIAI